jgi:hypothetical protein
MGSFLITTRALLLDEIKNWENSPIVFVTPDGDTWDPHTLHYAENEAAILDTNGLIVERDMQQPHLLFTEADIGQTYGNPIAWEQCRQCSHHIRLQEYLLSLD